MPKRALVERRPWLLASVAAALAYYWLKDRDFPGAYLLAIEAASLGLLGVYALLRHSGAGGRMVAAAMAMGGAGVVAVELDLYIGTILLIAGLAFLIGTFSTHTRERLSKSQKGAVLALLLLVPLIAWLAARGAPEQALVAMFGLGAGGMAAAAWASAFPRYRVGAGALAYVASFFVSMAATGAPGGAWLASLFAWPLFYLGHFLIGTGVIQTLRRKDGADRPNLRLVE